MPNQELFTVWALTQGQLIMSVQEDFARRNAKTSWGTIYFFADLSEVEV